MCPSVTFGTRRLVSADSPGKFYLLFFSIRRAVPENRRIISGILKVYSKKQIKSSGGKMFLKTLKKETQN